MIRVLPYTGHAIIDGKPHDLDFDEYEVIDYEPSDPSVGIRYDTFWLDTEFGVAEVCGSDVNSFMDAWEADYRAERSSDFY